MTPEQIPLLIFVAYGVYVAGLVWLYFTANPAGGIRNE